MIQWHGRKDGGFTLLELMLAIFIFSIVISLVYGAYNTTFKVYSQAEGATEVHNKARIAMERILEDLATAYVSGDKGLTGDSQDINSRRADTIEFLSTTHLNFNHKVQEPSIATIRYIVEEDGDSQMFKLFRGDFINRPKVNVPADDKGFMLCDNLWEVKFTYISSTGEESDEWTGENPNDQDGVKVLPAMIKVSLVFANKAGDGPDSHFTSALALGKIE
jgi:general secretion pathway protein J